MNHYKRKTDANQAMIVRSLRWAGYHVTDLSGAGNGIPDLLLTRNGSAILVEIKNREGRNRFTPAQLEYYAQVKCPVFVIRSINDVELLIKGEIQAINAPKTIINRAAQG